MFGVLTGILFILMAILVICTGTSLYSIVKLSDVQKYIVSSVLFAYGVLIVFNSLGILREYISKFLKRK